jgi:hypothetical protein
VNQDELRDYLEDVPTDWHPRFHELLALTEPFCTTHLNDEYRHLLREMAVALCQEDSPAQRGKAASWAAGMAYSVGWVNFLTSPESQPHMKSADIARAFGVAESTMMNKARTLREGLGLMPLHPDWCLESLLDENPLVWFQEINGVMVDFREVPRDLQQRACEAGLIPYVYADCHPAEADRSVLARIGPGRETGDGQPPEQGEPVAARPRDTPPRCST